MSMLSYGPLKDHPMDTEHLPEIDPFVDLVRRLHVPFYEEARIRFANRDLIEGWSDANEALPYCVEKLQGFIERYPATYEEV
jgi:hypothetical protein